MYIELAEPGASEIWDVPPLSLIRIMYVNFFSHYVNENNVINDFQDGHVAEDLIRILEQAEQQVPTFLTECSGGDGGGGGMRQKDRPRFGGRDIRMGNGGGGRENAQPKALELDEVW